LPDLGAESELQERHEKRQHQREAYLLPLRQARNSADAICKQGLNLWLENTFPDHMALEVLAKLIAKGILSVKAVRQQPIWWPGVKYHENFILGGHRWPR